MIEAVLRALDTALAKGDIEAAVSLFQDDCYWRDLVTFTWNIRTMEGKDAIRDMLRAQLGDVKPSNWMPAEGEDATEEDGVITGWFSFETRVARGFGHVRLKDGLIWTLLTSMTELKGHEEPLGFERPFGAKHGAGKFRKTWKEEREEEARTLGHTVQPYAVIVGGGQGGIALGARLRQLGVPTIIVEKNERPGDSWRKRYKSLCLHDPVWYDHLPYLPLPAELAGLLAKGQDRRLAGNVHQGDGAELLGLDRSARRRATTTQAKEWTVDRRPRRRGGRASAQAARARHRHVGQAEHADIQGHGAFQGRPAPFIAASGAGRLSRQEGRRHRLEQLCPRHCRRALGERCRCDDGPALHRPTS